MVGSWYLWFKLGKQKLKTRKDLTSNYNWECISGKVGVQFYNMECSVSNE